MALKNLPQLQYVLFEAIRFPIIIGDDGTETLGPPEQDKVLLLDRVYTSANYDYQALSTNTKFFGEDNYLNDKGGMAPVQIRLTGTFGFAGIRRGRTVRNGFQRLKEFRDELFKKINSVKESLVDKTLPTRKRYIYQCNFYDMINHEWMRIDLKKFNPNADGRIHTKVHFYTMTLEGIGPIIDIQGKDILIKLIKAAIKTEEMRERIAAAFERWLSEQPYIGEAYKTLNTIIDVFADLETTIGFANEYSAQANIMNSQYEQALRGITSLGGTFGNLNFTNPIGSVIGKLGSYIPIV